MADRHWLIFDDAVRDPAARAVFDRAVAQVNEGTARPEALSGQSIVGFVIDGQKVLAQALLEYAIGLVPAAEFDAAAAQAFTEKMRALLSWSAIDYTLRIWVERRLRDPYFVNTGRDWDEKWVLKPDADLTEVPDEYFRFACYVAIGGLKHGPSYASVGSERIFGWVTALGSDLPAALKKHGTGDLPADLIQFRGDGVTAKTNDALAVIRLTIAEEREDTYRQGLDYLIRLLTTTDFPRSFSIEFRGPTKSYLPIKGLPKKGVHQFFACAVQYPALWPAIEAYARAAMRRFEEYTNVGSENPAMPGTFAVFALGWTDASFASLVLDYLGEVDGEHQSMQGTFVEAYIQAHGFTPEAIAYLLACAGNIQHLTHRKYYPALIANPESLAALLAARQPSTEADASGIASLRANLLGESVDDYAWRHALYAIWGDAAEHRDADGRAGEAIIDAAPQELRALYEGIFA